MTLRGKVCEEEKCSVEEFSGREKPCIGREKPRRHGGWVLETDRCVKTEKARPKQFNSLPTPRTLEQGGMRAKYLKRLKMRGKRAPKCWQVACGCGLNLSRADFPQASWYRIVTAKHAPPTFPELPTSDIFGCPLSILPFAVRSTHGSRKAKMQGEKKCDAW
jgi:hypothetical protein